jgi:hypothetical protein
MKADDACDSHFRLFNHDRPPVLDGFPLGSARLQPARYSLALSERVSEITLDCDGGCFPMVTAANRLMRKGLASVVLPEHELGRSFMEL